MTPCKNVFAISDMSKPTIREVASRARVSISVASNALNRKGRVSEETRQRVEEAARAIGYVPSYAARRLRGASRAIGVLVMPFFEELLPVRYFSEPLYVLMQAAAEADYKLYYIHLSDDELSEEALQHIMRDGAIDGLVVMAPDPAQFELLANVLSDMPYVLFGAAPRREGVNYVDSDGCGGAMAATRHLLELGHTHVSYLMPGYGNYNARDRLRGYSAVMEEAGLAPTVYELADYKSPLPMDEMVNDGTTAVVAFDDFYAARVIGELQRLGLRVPQDVAVIGFDDEAFGRWMYPRLTTLRQPLTKMGAVAAEYLIQRLEAEEEIPLCREVLPVELVVRESCGAALE